MRFPPGQQIFVRRGDCLTFEGPFGSLSPPRLNKHHQSKQRWPRLSEQFFRIDKWSVCRGLGCQADGQRFAVPSRSNAWSCVRGQRPAPRPIRRVVVYKKGNWLCFNINYKFRLPARRRRSSISKSSTAMEQSPLLEVFRLDAALLLTSSIQMPFRAIPV